MNKYKVKHGGPGNIVSNEIIQANSPEEARRIKEDSFFSKRFCDVISVVLATDEDIKKYSF